MSRSADTRGRTRPDGQFRTLLLALAFLIVLAATPAAASADVGYQGNSYSGTSTPTGAKRAESVMWFNDGYWWASMWDTASADFHIFKLSTSTQTWQDTGTPIETRANAHADVKWDGTRLYVASHLFVSDESAAVSGYPSRLYRFSYDPTTDRYSLDSGFPVDINNYKTESLVIDKDSTGQLWATWQQGNQIYVNRSTTDDRTWGTPFALPVSNSSVTVDDISSLIAFGTNKIGLMWSNENSSVNGMYFSVHNDADADTTWQPSKAAVSGSPVADDHINLKALADGRVLATTKTGFTSSSLPLTQLLVRDPATGNWSSHRISTVAECPNRPTALIDQSAGLIHVLETHPGPGGTCNSAGGAIYEKVSSLSSISFPGGNGTPVIVDSDSPVVHNVSSTKQNVSSSTGLAALAINGSTARYWHHFAPLGGAPPPPPPPPPSPPVAAFSATPTSGYAPLAVSFHDSSTNSPTSWSWSFGDGTSSTAQNPNHTYTTPGTYTVTLTATNSGGSDGETKTGYITAIPPPPDFTISSSPTSRQVRQGSTTIYTITVSPTNGFSGTVGLSVSGVPSWTSASFSRTSIAVPPAGSSTLSVQPSVLTPTGTYTLTVRGVSGSLAHTVRVTLHVKRI